jgi:two-component system, cell cycle response regulator
MGEKILQRLSILPALPEAATRLLDHLADRNVSEFEIIALLESEEGMAQRLLAIMNQGMFGETRITTLTDLIDLLGLPRLRSAIVAYAVNRLFFESVGAKGRTTGLSTKISWDHALSVAFLGTELARRIKYPRLEEVLLSGLIHDIGRFVMMINLLSEYGEILGEIYGQVVNIVEMERSRFGFSHEQAGVLLVRHWQLPESFEAAVNYHHNCELVPEHQTVVHIISLANQLAVLEGTSFERGEPIDTENNISLHYLKLSAADIDAIVTSYREHIGTFKAAFQS